MSIVERPKRMPMWRRVTMVGGAAVLLLSLAGCYYPGYYDGGYSAYYDGGYGGYGGYPAYYGGGGSYYDGGGYYGGNYGYRRYPRYSSYDRDDYRRSYGSR